ncbi:MAG: acyltransferase [Acidobacteriota bacterium]
MSEPVSATRVVPGTRFRSLDGLRSLVILVLIVHFLDSVRFGPAGQALFLSVEIVASVALDVFFVLSGFLITGILLDTKRAPLYFRNFYIRRFLRIFPLYYGFLFVYFIVLPHVSGRFDDLRLTTTQHVYYWGYLTNVAKSFAWPLAPSTGHLWSLAVEEQFYLFWPAVIYACSRDRLRAVCWATLLLSPVIRLFLSYALPATIAYHQLIRMDVLAMGGLFALYFRSADGIVVVRRWLFPAAWLAAVATLLAGVFGAGWLARAVFSSASPYMAAAFFVITLEATPTTRWFRIACSRPLQMIGTYSYAIYVLHDPLADVMARFGLLDMPSRSGIYALVYTAVMISAAVLAGALSWHLYEKPLLRLKSAFAYQRPLMTAPGRTE